MKSKQELINSILALKKGETFFVSTGEESGCDVLKTDTGFDLLEVPLYGGFPRFLAAFREDEVERMISLALSLT
jgi:hypothetical protein